MGSWNAAEGRWEYDAEDNKETKPACDAAGVFTYVDIAGSANLKAASYRLVSCV